MVERDYRHGGRLAGAFAVALLALAAVLLPALPAAAQVITYTSATASWRDAQDTNGSTSPDPMIANGVPTSSVGWGGATAQSGSGYDVTIEILDPTQPPVADFTHRNVTVAPPWLTSVTLDIVVDFEVDGVPFGPLTFTYTFTHEETPNNLDPCPYPTPPGEGCTDRVTFLDAPIPTTFTVGGKTYTLGMTFLDGSGDPVDEFITSEGGVANTAELDVQFALVPPEFEVIKSGPATLAAGQAGVFTIDAQNVGPNEAWNTVIRDLFPDGATGGTCDATPEVLSARVFAADGVATIPGKGPLVQGADFTLSHTGAPTCDLTLTMLTAASVVDENERLIITYQTQLDGGTQFGVSLTNVAGATQWFDDDVSNPIRGSYVEALSDGTVGTVDHEDAHTLATGPLDYFFEKTVIDPVSGALLTTAQTGDTLRYRIRIENRTTTPLIGLAVTDEIDRLNGSPLFVPGSLSLVTVPTGATTGGTLPLGGAAGTGLVDVRNISVAPGASEVVEFDVTLVTPIAQGTLVTDQAELLANDVQLTLSDDPNVNGQANPLVVGDEDPTILTIVSAPSFLTQKTWADLTGDPAILRPGDTLQYTITVKNVGTDDAVDAAIRDALPGNTTYVAASTTLNGSPVPDGPGGTLPLAGGMPIYAPEDPTPGAMRADASATPDNVATIEFDVVVGPAVADGTLISNQAFVSAVAGAVDQPSDDPTTPLADDPTIVAVAASPPDPLLKDITQPSAAVGELFSYRITIPQVPHAVPLYDVRILDDLTASTADLRFVSVSRVSGTTPWTPVNTGTATDVVIEDTTTGIDIPAGDQIELEIFVVLEDTGNNTTGLVFSNTAGYTHNWVDGGPGTVTTGVPGVSADMTIEAPDLVMQKSGPPGLPGSSTAVYTLDVQNVGAATAWNPTLLDQIANPTPGGMCDVPPTAITARVFASDGTTPVGPVLVVSTDFTALFAPDPTCELTLSFTQPSIAIAPTERLIVTYELRLDADTPNGASLTNVAGAVEWFTADGSIPETAGDRRTVTETLTDGTVGTADHEDAHTLTTILPLVRFEKTVEDALTLAGPITQASPGDRLRYTIQIENVGSTPLTAFTFNDELDRLNTGQPAFDPGTLTIISIPTGATATNTDPIGGSAGTGSIEVTGLDLPNNGDTATIVFEIGLAPALPNGLVVQNQAELSIGGIPFWMSDDPNVNGGASPTVVGDEDPTAFTIASAPSFLIEKTSADLTGDPALLLAGDTLRYTITVKNVGTGGAIDASIRDAVPVNTTYVAGSTFLNGSPVADGPSGTLPLAGGMLISAPEDPTPGAMRADASTTPDNVATIVFSVVVDAGVPDGTVIANQGFVSAVSSGVVDQPSDDPATPVADDPTRDVVGNLPLLFAAKDVAIEVDNDGDGAVDPGDVLRYTITISNNGGMPATGATLSDAVPTNTTYMDDSVTLNSVPVGRPDGGVSPLIAGIDVSTPDQPSPPAPGMGTLTPGEVAVVEFLLVVNAGTPAGTIISNQAMVDTTELPNLPTDGDGDPATGPEPTVVVVGDGQQLSITKTVSVVGGGAALPGSELEYVVQVRNIATVPADDVVITDDLSAPVANQLTYVVGSGALNGDPSLVNVSGPLITADYSTTNGPLPPGATLTLRFRAVLDAGLAIGTPVTNTGVVSWNDPVQTASASVSLDVGGMPGVGVLSGTVWHDEDFDGAVGGTERLLQGWIVELLLNGTPIHTATVAADGTYAMGGLVPNDVTGDQYELRFRAPDAGANTGSLGLAQSPFANGPQQISAILVTSGSNLLGMNLPITPNGVVYDSVHRVPAAGAVLAMLNAGSGAALPTACFDDPLQQGQVSGADGYYKFDLNFSDPACPSGASYLIEVTGAGSQHTPGFSQIIPPETTAATTPHSVPACPGDAVVATGQYCEVQASAFAPPVTVPPRTAGSRYHAHLVLDATQQPGSSQIFNNHIAIDPALDATVSVSKSTPLTNVVLGQLVPYEITVGNETDGPLPPVEVVDRFPAGFRYVEGSAQLDGVPNEPQQSGRELTWSGIDVPPTERRSLKLLLAIGAGVGEGEFTNRAQVLSGLGAVPLTAEASATVRVVPDPDFACTDVLGRVFDDADRDGYQDDGELGLQGVRLATARGLIATTDQHGRFHITCAIVPREGRGSNFVLKLDDRSLPSGYRLSTRQLQIKRATRGKALRFSYGASIHRVVGLDLADAAFEPGGTELRAHWRERLSLLLEELQKAPATLRLSYVADVEDAKLVDARLDAIKDEISDAWKALDAYPLTIEPEVFWRHGTPARSLRPDMPDLGRLVSGANPIAGPPKVKDARVGNAVERHLSSEEPLTEWTQDPALLETEAGDRLEEQEVLKEQAETVKLKDVVPPIRFEAGVSEISPSYLQQLRRKLAEMQHLENVRLHFVGHADDQPLSGALARRYGDNEGLSRERAGEVAEFVQNALDLPPEAISFSWAGEAEPLASNATAEGRAMNRRVEVEVWYDEIGEKVGVEEVLVSDEFKRVKVCRVETVCKMRFIEGHERRARLKNLVPPLHLQEGQAGVPADYTRQIGQALENLQDKQNLTIKFVGFTDDAPLEGRNQRIYGTHLSLSKANARRVALAIRESLDLPSSAVASDGHGTARPIASNQTANGRSLNRRVEVEFWYDDPLQELPDEPQPCPDAAGEALITKVYDPPWGRLPVLPVRDGEPVVSDESSEVIARALAEVADRLNPRVRFLGYTGNERLDRRTSMVYGDDIGLSAARARRTKESIQSQLGLSDAQVEHEGRGFVHSNDVVNAGFIQGEDSHVVAQVVYDEPAVLDDYEGVEITELTRELTPKDPLALNLMRITVDGEPVDDPGRSSQDVQRCTDVALDKADIQFRFDGLEASPRLSVTSSANAVAVPEAAAGSKLSPRIDSTLQFRMYSNYSHFIERAEVRIFERGQSVQADPLAVVEIGPDGIAEWKPDDQRLAGPVRPLEFVLRAYGAKGRFDETAPQSLWMVNGDASVPADVALQDSAVEPDESGEESGEGDAAAAPSVALTTSGGADAALLAGYGESGPLIRNIDLGDVGTVRVQGGGVPSDHTVWLAGEPVPVDESGQFVAEVLLPKGMHTVEVSMLDPEGNGDLFLRDLDFDTSEWFYVAMADFTFSANKINGPEEQLQGENSSYDPDSVADGRLAFYLTGKFDGFGRDWRLTASADTREGKVEDLFSNFLDKSPGSLFRRIDPDYHYPTFGDDGTVNETAATSGKFFVKLDQKDNHALWGNFNVGYVDNELARVERGLYGANVHYQTEGTTRFGERRVMLDGFAADPGTVPSREEFRGTGGSLYYLRHRDILVGSERLLVEVRDKDSGLVTSVVQLDPDLDYDIDYFQGRILLAEPVSSTVEDNLLVRSQSLSGHQAWLVVNYEYAPGFDEIDQLAAGGTGHYWLNDFFKLGFTAYSNEEDGVESGLYGANLVARMSAESWLKFQGGFSQGLVSSSYRSNDGGFEFDGTAAPGSEEGEAGAFRVDGRVGFDDVIGGTGGQLSFYYQRLYAGYSAPGLNALNDTDHYGGTIDMPLLDRLNAAFKADRVVETDGLETTALEADVRFSWSEEITLSAGVRSEDREDNAAAVPVTQEEGTRTDLVVEAAYDPGGKWKGYAFGQASVQKDGNREANNRGGVGGSYRLNDRFEVDGEVSYGDSGAGVELGTNFQQTEQTSRYLSYSLDNERAANGVHARRGNLISGARTRLSESASVYMEDRYQHSKGENGLSRAVGLDWAPDERWSLGLDWEYGTLIDSRTNAKTNRNAGGGRVGYHYDKLQISSGIEYRGDETEQTDGSWSDRTTWLFRNDFRVQLTPDWRLLGKLNHSFSNSSLGEFYDGGYTEAVLGYAYRPVRNDRLNVLAKYTYFYNRPTTDVVGQEDASAEYLQKSHILSLDGTYDLTRSLTIGGKYAYRFGAVSLTREDPEFFDNSAHLVVARGDYRFLKNWETSLEGRMLLMPSLNERKGGAVITIYRYLGKNFKIGIGYNFTDFSEDLTDLSYDHHGFFFNLIGTL